MNDKQLHVLYMSLSFPNAPEAAEKTGISLSEYWETYMEAFREACDTLQPGSSKLVHLLTPSGRKAVIQNYLSARKPA